MTSAELDAIKRRLASWRDGGAYDDTFNWDMGAATNDIDALLALAEHWFTLRDLKGKMIDSGQMLLRELSKRTNVSEEYPGAVFMFDYTAQPVTGDPARAEPTATVTWDYRPADAVTDTTGEGGDATESDS